MCSLPLFLTLYLSVLMPLSIACFTFYLLFYEGFYILNSALTWTNAWNFSWDIRHNHIFWKVTFATVLYIRRFILLWGQPWDKTGHLNELHRNMTSINTESYMPTDRGKSTTGTKWRCPLYEFASDWQKFARYYDSYVFTRLIT